jgi:Tfp pilus assembly pilus retraction ATPase PilT
MGKQEGAPMSTESPQTVENPSLTKRVDEVSEELAALQQALAGARRSRLVLLLLTVLLVAAIVWVFYRFGEKFTQPAFAEQLSTVAQQRLEKNSDQYLKQLRELIDAVSPVLNDAITAQLKKDMPRYFEGMEKERDQLARTLTAQLGQRLEKHYAELLVRNEKIIEDEFPAVKDPVRRERMVANMDRAVQKLVKKYYMDEMERQFKELFATWDAFPPAPAPGLGDPAIEDQLLPEFIDLLKYKLSHTPDLARR